MVDKVGRGIQAKLRANAKRRQQAEAKLEAARLELAALLAVGKEAGLSITEIAGLAGVSRETVYQHLRKGKP